MIKGKYLCESLTNLMYSFTWLHKGNQVIFSRAVWDFLFLFGLMEHIHWEVVMLVQSDTGQPQRTLPVCPQGGQEPPHRLCGHLYGQVNSSEPGTVSKS